MRTNLAVTATEYPITDSTLIVSKTDTKGRLTVFNDQFVDAAGFTEAELMGHWPGIAIASSCKLISF